MQSVLVLLWIVLWIMVIVALCDSDGKCHQDCQWCPYAGDCPHEKERENMNEKM